MYVDFYVYVLGILCKFLLFEIVKAISLFFNLRFHNVFFLLGGVILLIACVVGHV